MIKCLSGKIQFRVCSRDFPSNSNLLQTLTVSFLALVVKVGPRGDRHVLRGPPEGSTKCQHPARPSRSLHPKPGIRERWKGPYSSKLLYVPMFCFSGFTFLGKVSMACSKSRGLIDFIFTLHVFGSSCGRLPRGERVWRQPGSKRRSGASPEAAENLPQEGLLQDPRCRQVTRPIRPSTNHVSEPKFVPSIQIILFPPETQTNRRSWRPTGSWRSSGTPTTSSQRAIKRRQRRSSLTSPRPKKSSQIQVRSSDGHL